MQTALLTIKKTVKVNKHFLTSQTLLTEKCLKTVKKFTNMALFVQKTVIIAI